MATLSDEVSQAWEDRDGPIVLATVDEHGKPNAIYATCVNKYSNEKIVVADNYFSKTRANILAGSNGSILFITKDGKAFQLKGTIEYERSGDIYDDMKEWLAPKFPGHAAAVLCVEEVYSGANRLI